ncbi:MAG TPA: hypothetical protein VJN29_13765 [Intrasporangium sp.]|uniref:hypothetical protein n=1 Tax=Intrasporangium sp. TaxID=1925024 RepID=UPI002B48C4C8|nr:hypothetical protein [Intrasporangium sp.]HKX68280.1 hypothetical protein [Intrasporangium sp.]
MPDEFSASPDQLVELHALGARVRVDLRGAAPVLVREFQRVWRRCLAPSSGSPVPRELDAGTVSLAGELAHVVPDASRDVAAGALTRSTQRITGALIAAQAGRLLMLHAGALCHPDTGASVVYVAPGGTGKTTLSRALGHELAYLTDETVGITEDRRILPYPKPLTLRRPSGGRAKVEHAPDDLGLLEPRADPWVAGVMLIRRDPSMVGVSVEPLSVADALLLLAAEASSLARLERPLHRLADLGHATGGFRLVRYAEAADLAELVRDTVGGRR